MTGSMTTSRDITPQLFKPGRVAELPCGLLHSQVELFSTQLHKLLFKVLL